MNILKQQDPDELEAAIASSALIVELCDGALADLKSFRRNPYSIIKGFVRKYPGTEIADVKATVNQLRRIDREGSEKMLREFRNAMHNEIPSGRN